MPSGPGVRVDTAIEAGDRVPPDYDNLIAKVMVHAPDRDAAIDRLRRALDEAEVGGVQTTLPFHRAVARSGAFRRGELSTSWVEVNWDGAAARAEAVRKALVATGLAVLDGSASAAARVAPSASRETGSGGQTVGGAWRRGARAQGVDRWPS
jgi:acetyl/propionyl-CoA carboxylase alpha subunit